MTASGDYAPLFVTVKGLDADLPFEGDVLALTVPGLCPGGGVGGNDAVGHVLFMKRHEGSEQTRYAYYHKHVLTPFYASIRKRYFDFDSGSGIPIPEELTAVAWMDGDLPQVKAVAEEWRLFRENKIEVNKQNPARTGVEQPADLARVFKVIKNMIKKHTVSKVDPSNHPLKRILLNAVMRVEER
jgi:hypothetical protein